MSFIGKGEGIVEGETKELAVFKIVFKHLLGFSLSEPTSEWKNSNRFDIFTQAIMTDTNILEELNLVESKIYEIETFN